MGLSPSSKWLRRPLSRRLHSDGIAEREQAHLSVLRGEGAARVILIAHNGATADYAALRSWDIPVVIVDRVPVGLQADLVCTDSREGINEAMAHLLAQHKLQH